MNKLEIEVLPKKLCEVLKAIERLEKQGVIKKPSYRLYPCTNQCYN